MVENVLDDLGDDDRVEAVGGEVPERLLAVEVHLEELHPGALEDPCALGRKTRVGPGHAAPQMRQEAAEVAVEAADVEDASISKPGQPEHQVGHHTPHVRRVEGQCSSMNQRLSW